VSRIVADKIIEKVTAFVTREGANGRELLVFHHPHAGIQVPAGTVEPNETPELAVRREVEEETGLISVTIAAYLGRAEQPSLDGKQALYRDAMLQSAPQRDATMMRATLQRGWMVVVGESSQGFVKVMCRDTDSESGLIISQMSGWIPESSLATRVERHFYHVPTVGSTLDSWQQIADRGFTFDLFWTPLATAQIHPAQQWWLDYARVNGLT